MSVTVPQQESAIDKLFHDTRPIDELPFAPEVAERVRHILKDAGCEVADDIDTLGCTGIAQSVVAVSPGLLDTITFLRLGLAGSGHGLPCFVPPTLFCLGHNTIGGLQQGQLARHAEIVERISRPLTDDERANNALVDAARRRGRKDPDEAADILQGREELEIDAGGEVPPLEEQPKAAGPTPEEFAQGVQGMKAMFREAFPDIAEKLAWKCIDHTETNWACRYCVAQAVVEGPVEPEYMVASEIQNPDHEVVDNEHDDVRGSDVTAHISTCETGGCTSATIFVRAASFTRKLARD